MAPDRAAQTAGPATGAPAVATAAGAAPATGAAATVSITGESPGEILGQLAQVKPSMAQAAFGQAEKASIMALQKQTGDLPASLPEIPAPTGIAAGGSEAAAAATVVASQAASAAIEGEQSGREGETYDASVEEAPAPPTPAPTVLSAAPGAEPDEPDPVLAASARRASETAGLMHTPVSASAGTPSRGRHERRGRSEPARRLRRLGRSPGRQRPVRGGEPDSA